MSENIFNYNRVRVATHADSTGMVTFRQLEREGAVFKPGDYSARYFMDGDSINTSFMEFQTPKVALLGLLNGDYKYYVWGEEPLKWKIAGSTPNASRRRWTSTGFTPPSASWY